MYMNISQIIQNSGGVAMFYDGIRVYMQNGKLDDVEIAYYIDKLKKIYKSKELKRISFILGENYIDLRYIFKAYPFERIWRVSTEDKIIGSAI